MPASLLITTLSTFARCLKDARDLANDANAWSIPGAAHQITPQRRDVLTETAFLRAFTGWESFLEESFYLYMLGYKIPKRRPHRYAFPPDRSAATEWCAEGHRYAKWDLENVRKRAGRWFKDGKPFAPALQAQQARLTQLATIRNAIAHQSTSARGKFEALVRNELGALPPNTTVGSFLLTTVPTSNPPTSYMEFYLEEIDTAARNIVAK
jgi:hypothetical protein